jgi:hypothetical protein
MVPQVRRSTGRAPSKSVGLLEELGGNDVKDRIAEVGFDSLPKNKRARRPCDRRARKWVVGVRQSLFPMPALGAHPRGGCQLPDAILHGKRSYRPRSRAVEGVDRRPIIE